MGRLAKGAAAKSDGGNDLFEPLYRISWSA